MKRSVCSCLAIILSLVIPFSMVTFTQILVFTNQDFTGERTEASPFLFGTADQFVKLKTLVNTGDVAYNALSYQMKNDIDLSGIDNNLTPMGSINSFQDKVGDFVTRFYQFCLSRDPDPAGLNGWVDALISGRNTGADVANGFVFSNEFKSRTINDTDYVTIMYRAFFNREPDTGGFNSWIDTLENGMSRYSVLAGFVNSNEFKALASSFGINPGSLTFTRPADMYPQVTAFVTRFYKLCLNRMPDADGVNAWVTNLKTSKSSGVGVSYGFVFSNEFQNRNVSNAEFVTIMYLAFLGREPDIGGLNAWTGVLNAGNSRYHVLVGFGNSIEFGELCQEYGITGGKLIPTPPPTATTVTPVVFNVYYVAKAGSDTSTGTATAPFRTIQRAINVVPSGSTIIVTAGTYNEKLSISGKSGLVIKNRPGEMPILSGAGYSSGYLIDILGSNNIVFSGFEVCDFKGPNLEGIVIRNVSSNIEISNCKFHDIATTESMGNAHVILAKGDSNTPMRNITVKNNEVYNCKSGWSESITVQSNIDGFSISNNNIHDVTNIAIDAAGFYSNGVTQVSMNQARNGVIADNLIYNLYCQYAPCAAIYVDGGKDIVIEGNTIHNSMYGIEVGCENPVDSVNTSVRAIVSGIIVRNNTVYNNTKIGIGIGGYNGTQTGQVINSQITNNTLYMNQTELELAYCDNISLSNNIFYGAGDSNHLIYCDPVNVVSNLKMSKNVYFTNSGSGYFEINSKSAYILSAWQNITGQDLNSLFIDPLFVNKTSYDFRLPAGSPITGIGAK